MIARVCCRYCLGRSALTGRFTSHARPCLFQAAADFRAFIATGLSVKARPSVWSGNTLKP
jgi:hypothetical protein